MSRDLAKAVGGEVRPAAMNLKGCPHCGSANLQAVQSVQESGDPGDFTIECQVCLAAGPPGGILEEAGRRWNLRA